MSAVLAIGMGPFEFAWLDAGNVTATTPPEVVAGGPPGVVEPCGTDLFTGLPIAC